MKYAGGCLRSKGHSFDFEKWDPVGEALVPDLDVFVVDFGKQFHKVGEGELALFVYTFAVNPVDFEFGGIEGGEFESREIRGVGTGDLSLRIVDDDEVAPEQFSK